RSAAELFIRSTTCTSCGGAKVGAPPWLAQAESSRAAMIAAAMNFTRWIKTRIISSLPLVGHGNGSGSPALITVVIVVTRVYVIDIGRRIQNSAVFGDPGGNDDLGVAAREPVAAEGIPCCSCRDQRERGFRPLVIGD